jgi:hypothetical protein
MERPIHALVTDELLHVTVQATGVVEEGSIWCGLTIERRGPDQRHEECGALGPPLAQRRHRRVGRQWPAQIAREPPEKIRADGEVRERDHLELRFRARALSRQVNRGLALPAQWGAGGRF